MKFIKLSFFFVLLIISCKKDHYPNLTDGLYADIQTDKGNILVQLSYEDVPITVANFVSLAEGSNPYVSENYKGKPYYKGLKFHRVVKNYIIQGGDPMGNGTGGPGFQFEDEFPTNDDANLLLSHDRKGVLSMANSGPDTNGSQFFITHKATPKLDGVHTVFGYVIDGQKIVDTIETDDIINKINILRKGTAAKIFNATKVFTTYFKKLEEEARKRFEKFQKAKANFLKLKKAYETKAEVLHSGLKIYYIKKGKGVKPTIGSKVQVFYTGYFKTGELFESNSKETSELYQKYDYRREAIGGYDPASMHYSPDAELIPGFREGLLLMNIGDKVMLFLPSHLAYGSQGSRSIPPDTDLIYELELLE